MTKAFFSAFGRIISCSAKKVVLLYTCIDRAPCTIDEMRIAIPSKKSFARTQCLTVYAHRFLQVPGPLPTVSPREGGGV
jgi:hypothetical protein